MATHNMWILTAGTGLIDGVLEPVRVTAAAVGHAIARAGCGLVTGGWDGVDYITGEAFVLAERSKGGRIEDRFVQVVTEDRDGLPLQAGRVVRTKRGPLEWLEPQSYAHAVVLIGGIGGTYGTFLSALHKGLPRFPLGGTGGDATRAFQQMCELWDLFPNPGIAKSDFERIGRSIASRHDADTLAEEVVALVVQSVAHHQRETPRSLFISYSRSDAEWRQRVLTALKPLEHAGLVRLWTDVEIEAGSQWDAELRRQLSVCDIAVLLVSPRFLSSSYVQDVELPVLLERAWARRTHLFWVEIASSSWQDTILSRAQAALDLRTPLSDLSPADAHVALVELRQKIESVL